MSSRDLDVEAILAGIGAPVPEGHRAGVVALCGRPNVGKSTLLNHLAGEKVSIVTPVPGTTRNTIRAVLTRDDAQVVLLDTPGLSRPRTLLARRLNDQVRDTWASVDVIVLIVDVAAGVGPGDGFLAGELARVDTPVIAVANKIDLVSRKELLLPALERLDGLMGQRSFADVVPVSAATGENVEVLLDRIVAHLAPGGRLFPTGQVSDQPERQLAAEILREKLIVDARDELPHSIAVVVDEVAADPDRDDLVRIDAVIYVERDSQKGIVIGRGGERLKHAASQARRELEAILGVRVFLTTHVSVAREWQRDPKQLGRLGY